MDWQRPIAFLLSLLAMGIALMLGLLPASCTSSQQQHAILPFGQITTQSAKSFGSPTTLSSYALAYQVAISEKYLVYTEINLNTELIVQAYSESQTSNRPTFKKPRRVEIDDATYEISEILILSTNNSIIVSSKAGWIRNYDLASLKLNYQWNTGSPVNAVVLSDDESLAYYGTDNGVLCMRRIQDHALLQCLQVSQNKIVALAWSKTALFSLTSEGQLDAWTPESLARRGGLALEKPGGDLALNSDASLLAVVANGRADYQSTELAKLKEQGFRPQGPGESRIELFGVAGEPTSAKLLSLPPRRVFIGHRAKIQSIAWVGQNLLSVSWDRTLRLWSMDEKEAIAEIQAGTHILYDVAARVRGALLVVAGWGTTKDAPALQWLRLKF